MTERSPRVAIVTGASRGLGRAIAMDLARAGHAIALAARDEDALNAVAGKIAAETNVLTLVLAADLSQPNEPARVVAETVERFGRIDALVNNAGDTQRGDFLELDDAQHLSGFALKYHATVRFCRAAWPYLEASRGAVVNISGIGAHTPDPLFTIGGPVNSAIINFSKGISKCKGAPRVNVVCPGHIQTDRLTRRIETFARRNDLSEDDAARGLRERLGVEAFGRPGDIAAMVRYLCSPEADYITGSVFTVDGGATPGI